MTLPTVLATGLYYPEGLIWCSEEDTLLCSTVQEGALYRIRHGRPERMALTGGGANNIALGTDGSVIVAQNGGIDAHRWLASMFDDLGDWPEVTSARPGLQEVTRDGAVRSLLDSGANAPNDIVVGLDGDLYFSDPGNPFLPAKPPARVMRLACDGRLTVHADGFDYCNGLEVCRDGSLLVVDNNAVIKLAADGSRSIFAEQPVGSTGDGIALDEEERLYVATSRESGLRVFENGKEVDFLPVGDQAVITNCCFGGPDYTWLFASDAHRGRILVWKSMPFAGRRPRRWDPQPDPQPSPREFA